MHCKLYTYFWLRVPVYSIVVQNYVLYYSKKLKRWFRRVTPGKTLIKIHLVSLGLERLLYFRKIDASCFDIRFNRHSCSISNARFNYYLTRHNPFFGNSTQTCYGWIFSFENNLGENFVTKHCEQYSKLIINSIKNYIYVNNWKKIPFGRTRFITFVQDYYFQFTSYTFLSN